MQEKRLFLLDAYALIYRAYYAFLNNPMYSSKGLNTSTVFGFLISLDEIIRNQKPTHLVAAFDTSQPTFRHDIFPEYKANRMATPEDIRTSVPILRKVLELMNIAIIELPGFEADDIIGTLAKRAKDKDFTVYMVTPDKDYCQLVDDRIFVYKPKKSGNEAEVWGIEQVKEKFSIEQVDQVIDILALWGDASDNVPGVPGVGEKTAKKLIADFKNVDGVLENLDKLSQKQRDSFIQHKDDLILSRKLVTIDINVPISFDEELYRLKPFNAPELKALLTELNFKNLISRLFNEQVMSKTKQETVVQGDLFSIATEPIAENAASSSFETAETLKHTYKCIDSNNEVKELTNYLKQFSEICFDTETTSLDPHSGALVGISFSVKQFEAFYINVPEDRNEALTRIRILEEIFVNEAITKIGHNLKFDILFLHYYGIKVKGSLIDTMLMHYLLHPELNHKMDNLAENYLNYKPIPIESLIGGKGSGQMSMRNVPLDKITEYAAEDADVTLRLYHILKPKIDELGLNSLFSNIESKLLKVLIDIELNGFNIDVEYLNNYNITLTNQIKDIENEIYKHAEINFNIASPKQLGEILFEKLSIPYEGKLTKTKQYSTNEEVLQQLTDKHPIVNKILEYRGLTKLLSTYVETLPKMINKKSGKIHTSFNQSLAVTGRLSSNNPNLQNIPIRDEQGREIRKAFIPSKGNILLSADYSQIELRLIAHMSNDSNMIEAFQNNSDIHISTASKVFKVPVNEVTKDQRSKAKTANFGIIYGISGFGLAQRMNISRKEANEIIAEYFNTFPGVKQYMTNIVLFAKENGYVETLLKRRRYLPDIKSQNATVRSFAERNAINSPIQGTAADIIKIAMIKILETFQKNNIQSKMILQVHDELIFDVLPSELDVVQKFVKEEMEGAIKLNVPLIVEMGTGNNWLEAH